LNQKLTTSSIGKAVLLRMRKKRLQATTSGKRGGRQSEAKIAELKKGTLG